MCLQFYTNITLVEIMIITIAKKASFGFALTTKNTIVYSLLAAMSLQDIVKEIQQLMRSFCTDTHTVT